VTLPPRLHRRSTRAASARIEPKGPGSSFRPVPYAASRVVGVGVLGNDAAGTMFKAAKRSPDRTPEDRGDKKAVIPGLNRNPEPAFSRLPKDPCYRRRSKRRRERGLFVWFPCGHHLESTGGGAAPQEVLCARNHRLSSLADVVKCGRWLSQAVEGIDGRVPQSPRGRPESTACTLTAALESSVLVRNILPPSSQEVHHCGWGGPRGIDDRCSRLAVPPFPSRSHGNNIQRPGREGNHMAGMGTCVGWALPPKM